MRYAIEDHGKEHAQYFQGAGTIGTIYTDIVTGVGENPREAAEDALDQFWMSVDKNQITVAESEALEAAIQKFQAAPSAHLDCTREWTAERSNPKSTISDFDRWHEDCEIAWRVSIRWAY